MLETNISGPPDVQYTRIKTALKSWCPASAVEREHHAGQQERHRTRP
jgi:hypothetical protein